jgi:polyphosphate kinase
VLPRLIRMPAKVSGDRLLFVSLSSVIRAHLAELFAGRSVGQFSQFRVTRHSDLAVDEDDVKNLRMALRQGLQFTAITGRRSAWRCLRVVPSTCLISCSNSLICLPKPCTAWQVR